MFLAKLCQSCVLLCAGVNQRCEERRIVIPARISTVESHRVSLAAGDRPVDDGEFRFPELLAVDDDVVEVARLSVPY